VWQKLSSVLDDSIDNLIVKEEEIDVKWEVFHSYY
jgi:hypothetical protein